MRHFRDSFIEKYNYISRQNTSISTQNSCSSFVESFYFGGASGPSVDPKSTKRIVKPEFGSISKRNLHLILSSIKMMKQ